MTRGYPDMEQVGRVGVENTSKMRELGGEGRCPGYEAVCLLRGTGTPALKL